MALRSTLWRSGQRLSGAAVFRGLQSRSCSTANVAANVTPAVKPKRRVLRKVFLGLAGVTAAGVGAASYYRKVDPGFDRTLQFWGVGFPIYMHYRLVQWQSNTFNWSDEKEDAEFEILHNRYAPIAEELVLRMKGMYLKNAQLVSTRDEFLPPQYMEFCKRMQDQVPTDFRPGEARRKIESSLGKKLEEVFEWFDEEPLGAASIGQVHRARLHGGREVVVKVQYDNIEDMFRSDITTMIYFCKLAQPQHVKPLREIEKQFLTEFDYRGEAQNLDDIRNNIMPIFGKEVYIPKPHMEFCTREVLVMDFVPGKTLINGIMDQHKRFAKMMGVTLEELQADFKAKLQSGELQLRSLREDAEHTRKLQQQLQMVDTLKNTGRFFYNWTVGWVATPKEYKWNEQLLNLGSIMDLLNRVHAHEIFIDGAFNGDPHPGNILLLPDGRIGLIDYGQVKRMNIDDRISLAKLTLALARGTKQDVLDHYIASGVRTKNMNPDIIYRLACFWNDRDTDDVTGGRNVQTFMDWAEATDPLEDVPQDLIMAARVSVMLRGMANAFGMKLRTAPLWASTAEQFLLEQGVDPDDAIRHKLEELEDARDHE